MALRKSKIRNNIQYYFALFNVFSVITLFVNLTFYLFPFFFRNVTKSKKARRGFTLEYKLSIIFLLGTLISVFDVWTLDQGKERIINALIVLPNYIYWIIILYTFNRYRDSIDMNMVGKGALWGILACIFYSDMPFLNELRNTIFFKNLQQNIFAFIIIIFCPIALLYVHHKWGDLRLYLIAIVFVVAAALSESRSGTLLVFIEAVIFISYLNRNKILIYIGAFIFFLTLLISSLFIDVAENMIYQLNPRAHELLFEDDVLNHDQSFLTRKAIIEKGFSLFERSPYTGVGINNFSK